VKEKQKAKGESLFMLLGLWCNWEQDAQKFKRFSISDQCLLIGEIFPKLSPHLLRLFELKQKLLDPTTFDQTGLLLKALILIPLKFRNYNSIIQA